MSTNLMILILCDFAFALIHACSEPETCFEMWIEAENMYNPKHLTTNCIFRIKQNCPDFIDIEFVSEHKEPHWIHGYHTIERKAKYKGATPRIIDVIYFTEKKQIKLCAEDEDGDCDYWWKTVKASLIRRLTKQECVGLLLKHCSDIIRLKDSSTDPKGYTTNTYVYKENKEVTLRQK